MRCIDQAFMKVMPVSKQLRMSMIILEGEKENIYLEIMTFMNLLKQLVMIHFSSIVIEKKLRKVLMLLF